MLGDNLPATIATPDDARAIAAAIAALRTEIEANERAWADEMEPLTTELREMRGQREEENRPSAERMEALRKVLASWLAGDPDGALKDGDLIVATLARKACKPQIHADQLPPEYLSMQPNVGAINAALARGEKVPGVVVKVETSLRVL